MKSHLFILSLSSILLAFVPMKFQAQTLLPNANARYYLVHTSGNVACADADGRAVLREVSGSKQQLLQFVSDKAGCYWVKLSGEKQYMAVNGNGSISFVADSTTNASKYTVEKASNSCVRLKSKFNGKYLDAQSIADGSYLYSHKKGAKGKCSWYISEYVGDSSVNAVQYLINPNDRFKKPFEGWGVSLCWWANMCGKWSDENIDQIVDWLVSRDGLNYNIFRYNIGGGDDPLNRHCDPHHMGKGKGLRAEMEGFKDSINAEYNWSRDAAQRKIMLKIKEKRPDAIFEAFSNSCPYYMTYSGCCAGNVNALQDNLKPEYYEAFAHYLVDVCKFYKDSFNIEFKTLEPFNEPVTDYWNANGSQEGCHFSTTAQIAFLKVLAPVLKESGLKTVISASDETSVEQSVTDFKAYASDSIALGLIGQWNTHTYTVSNHARAKIRALCTTYDKTLWMSEVGSGGSGISGNLTLAQILMKDIRYIRPEAWVDWQYMEEGNDQWGLLSGSFANQTCQRVKNYYVRQQISRYITVGSRFLSVPNEQMLAALNPTGDSLIIVALNSKAFSVCHKIDLSFFSKVGGSITATRTSNTEANAVVSDFKLRGTMLSVSLPSYSITTLVCPVRTATNSHE